MKFMITNKSSGPAMNCSQTFKNQEEVKFMNQEKWPKASRKIGVSKHEGNLCRPSHSFSKEGHPTHKKNRSYE